MIVVITVITSSTSIPNIIRITRTTIVVIVAIITVTAHLGYKSGGILLGNVLPVAHRPPRRCSLRSRGHQVCLLDGDPMTSSAA